MKKHPSLRVPLISWLVRCIFLFEFHMHVDFICGLCEICFWGCVTAHIWQANHYTNGARVQEMSASEKAAVLCLPRLAR